jgi:hypothetical protein
MVFAFVAFEIVGCGSWKNRNGDTSRKMMEVPPHAV